MRKFNVELAKINLAKLEVQHDSLSNRLDALQQEMTVVAEKQAAKRQQIEELQAKITNSTTSVDTAA